MKKCFVLFLLIANICSANELFWSKTGHRVVGEVAEAHLTRKARKAIAKLLNGQDLAAVSNFADEIKADEAFREFGPWHYVNLPLDKDYPDVAPSPEGDVVMGIETCIRILKDETSSLKDREFYLKLLVHLVGDLHQPMHVGRAEDKGGNDLQLQWFGRGTNLHRLWDSNMIDDYGMSYTELTNKLPILTKTQLTALKMGNVRTWVEETQQVAAQVYASVEVGEKLGYRYSYDWWPTVELQLQKGGIRLAAVLNDIFK
jgi:hypothetical protein